MEKITNNKLKMMVALAISIAVILIMSFAILKTTQNSKVVEIPDILYIGHDEVADENFSKEAAVTALKELFANVEKDVEGSNRTIDERLAIIAEDNIGIEDIFTEDVINSIYFAEEFGSYEFNKKFTASSLLVYNKIIANDEGDYIYNFDSFKDLIYLDNRFMTAHIPLDLFIGMPTGIAFEMQYVDKEWKLNPYTALMSLQALGMQEEQRAIEEAK